MGKVNLKGKSGLVKCKQKLNQSYWASFINSLWSHTVN